MVLNNEVDGKNLEVSNFANGSMRIHVVRLLPGEDIILSIQNFAKRKHIRAGVILTCVGSTGHTTLRPAGRKEGKIFKGKHEIVSLTGTFNADGQHHLHCSISDEVCKVYGGHMLRGCLVRTTVELVLGDIANMDFKRDKDPRTGFSELFVYRVPTFLERALFLSATLSTICFSWILIYGNESYLASILRSRITSNTQANKYKRGWA